MSIAEGLSGIFEDPSLLNRANTWSQTNNFDGPVNYNEGLGIIGSYGANPGVHWNSFAPNGFNPGGNMGFYLSNDTQGTVFNTNIKTAGLPGMGFQVQGGAVIGLGLPTLTTPTIASGTVYQNATNTYQTLRIAAYAATAGTAGSVAVALGTSSTPSTIETDYVSGGSSSTVTVPIVLRVPPQWYYSLTVTSATIGTVTQIQE